LRALYIFMTFLWATTIRMTTTATLDNTIPVMAQPVSFLSESVCGAGWGCGCGLFEVGIGVVGEVEGVSGVLLVVVPLAVVVSGDLVLLVVVSGAFVVDVVMVPLVVVDGVVLLVVVDGVVVLVVVVVVVVVVLVVVVVGT